MRHGKALLGDKVRYTVEMLMSAVPSQSPCGRQLPPRGAWRRIICSIEFAGYKKDEKGLWVEHQHPPVLRRVCV